MKVPDKIPEWLAMLPKEALLDSKDLAKLLGYKNANIAAHSLRVNNHGFPEPDVRGNLTFVMNDGIERRSGNHRSLRWKAVTIRNYIRQYNRGELK